MAKFSIGDKVNCRILEEEIVDKLSYHDDVKTFEIIGVDVYGYYLYLPRYLNIKNYFNLDYHNCKKYHIDPKYISEKAIHIEECQIDKIHSRMDGMSCCCCRQFFSFVEPNFSEQQFKCWSCRQAISQVLD